MSLFDGILESEQRDTRVGELAFDVRAFDDPQRDELRRMADHFAATAPHPNERLKWNERAALLSDANPTFAREEKRSAAIHVRREQSRRAV